MSEKTSTYFLTHDRFRDYFCETKMYKEVYQSKESWISIIIGGMVTYFTIFIVLPVINPTNNFLNLLTIIVGGAFGLLGFLIGGMALIVGSISDRMINIIDEGKAFDQLLAIIFRFYYDGAIIGLLIFVSIFDYLLLILPIPFYPWLLGTITFINTYLFCYSTILSVMLLGTPIRLLLLRHKFSGL